MKDRITILVCGNANGDCKIKPRIFKSKKVMKSKLPVMWTSCAQSWCTRQFLVEWVHQSFGPQVKGYLKEKHVPLKKAEHQRLPEEQQKTMADDLSSDGDEVRESALSSKIKEMCAKWGKCSYL